jgi:beta-phosphoglucomutase-like phosphatase (HAD superfamily)
MPLRAIVFDFDGVIANTEPLHLTAAQRVLAGRGVSLDEVEYYDRYLGFDDAGMYRALAARRGLPAEARDVHRYVEEKTQVLQSLIDDGSVLFAGVRECIARCAARTPLAIASGALGHEIEMILRRTGLRDAFQVIVGAGDTPRSKPAPDPYTLAVERLRAMPVKDLGADQCIAIEDSQWGLESARAAGLRCVAVAHTYPAASFRDVDFVAATLAEITIERLEAICG